MDLWFSFISACLSLSSPFKFGFLSVGFVGCGFWGYGGSWVAGFDGRGWLGLMVGCGGHGWLGLMVVGSWV